MQTEAYIKIIIKKNEYKILDGWILVIPAIIAFAFRYHPKSLENSKSALVCYSDELRGWVCNDTQRVKIAFQPLQASIRANWEFSSNCDTTPHFWGYLVLVLLCLVLFLIQLAIKVSKSNIQTYHWVFKCKRPRRFSYFC